MGQRVELQSILEDILGTDNVYFQPPGNLQMKYPCIVYKRDGVNSKFADNQTYTDKVRYQVTYIDRNPDVDILSRMLKLPLCSYIRYFPANNLNHDVFNLYF